jgi:BirA family transcriptional regulator, biotin operon repressor / biotin---[acetyl-CoA-carboxylase] ligase
LSEELAAWPGALESALASSSLVRRAIVLRETSSTQDAALRAWSGGGGGLIVVAGRQSAGRGRLGRSWTDDAGEGLACTLALAGPRFDPAHLSLAAGLAAARAVDRFLPAERGSPPMAIRWPNDVVEPAGLERKIAGVLIEIRGGAALVGIGINVLQRQWPADLARRAVSLHQLGAAATRLDVALALIAELERALHAPADELAREWAGRNILHGRHVAFVCGGITREGEVFSITPASEIVLRDRSGEVHRLPAAQTSMVHGTTGGADQDCPAT